MNFLRSVLGPPCKIDVELEGLDKRATVEVTTQEEKTEKIPLYIGNEIVKGTVSIKLEPNTKKIEHIGIKIALIGTIRSTSGNVYDFLSVVKELEPAGLLTDSKSYPFEF